MIESSMVECRACKKEVRSDAIKCPYCRISWPDITKAGKVYVAIGSGCLIIPVLLVSLSVLIVFILNTGIPLLKIFQIYIFVAGCALVYATKKLDGGIPKALRIFGLILIVVMVFIILNGWYYSLNTY